MTSRERASSTVPTTAMTGHAGELTSSAWPRPVMSRPSPGGAGAGRTACLSERSGRRSACLALAFVRRLHQPRPPSRLLLLDAVDNVGEPPVTRREVVVRRIEHHVLPSLVLERLAGFGEPDVVVVPVEDLPQAGEHHDH